MKRTLLFAVAALAFGCAGKATMGSSNASGATGDASAGGAGKTPGCQDVQCPSFACPGTDDFVTPPGWCCPVCMPRDGGGVLAVDASVPPPAMSEPDAGCVDVSACSLKPADVACSNDSDCKQLSVPGCCGDSVIGVSKSSSPQCGTPACGPGANCQSGGSSIAVEQCGFWTPPDAGGDGTTSIVVVCYQHECMSEIVCTTCLK